MTNHNTSVLLNHENLTEVVSLYPISSYDRIFLSIGYYLISLMSVFGNSFIILAIMLNKSMHNVTNYFITNLAVVDIIISVFSTPFQFQAAILQQWPWLPILCKLGPFSTTLNINISVLTLVAISLDRFYVIYYPLKPKLRIRHCLIIIGFIWLGSLVLSSYQLFSFQVIDEKVVDEENVTYVITQCENSDRNYSAYHLTSLFLIQYLLPFLILWSTFFAIGYKIYFSADKRLMSNKTNHKNRKKVIKMILIVLFCFVICWTPLQLYNLLSIVKPSINHFYYINIIWLIANMFAMSNSCYNFLIYGFCSTRFRREFKRLYRKLLCLRRAREKINTSRGRNNSFRETQVILDSSLNAQVQTRFIKINNNNSFHSFA